MVARTNHRPFRLPQPRPPPLPQDPDVTGTFPPPPSSSFCSFELQAGPRARAASCPAQPRGCVRAPQPARDAPPALERALPRASPALGPPLAPPRTSSTSAPPTFSLPLRSGDRSLAARPESSQPPHCTTGFPTVYTARPVSVCVYSVSHRRRRRWRKRRRSALAGIAAAHTLTQSLSPSASRSLTHTPGAPERALSRAPRKS